MKLLLLAGTLDAVQIASGLARDRVVTVEASCEGDVPGNPAETGLGHIQLVQQDDTESFCAFLDEHGVTAILDAGDPFRADLSQKTAAIAEERGIAYLRFLRPAWQPEPDDRWEFITQLPDIPGRIDSGERVFVACGRGALDDLSGLTRHKVYCRAKDEEGGAFPLPDGAFVSGTAPFSTESEIELFSRLGIEWLVARNEGSNDGRATIDAARFLGLRVAMLRRPPQPNVPRVNSVAAALSWARQRA